MTTLDVQGSTILVIDDTPTNLDVLSDFLHQAGYRVLLKKDGISGIKLATKRQPDLILLDIMMPEIDGYQTCLQLKESEDTRDIPVIFMSALSDTIDKVKGFEVGAVDYITKPFQAEEALARVKTHLTLIHMKKIQDVNNQQLQREVQHRRMAEVSLSQSRILLDSVLKISLDAIAAFEATRDEAFNLIDFTWKMANPIMCKMVGQTEKELVGKAMSETFPRLMEDGRMASYMQVVNQGENLNREIRLEYDSFRGWLELSAVKLADGLAITLRDITRLKSATLKLEKQSKQDGLTGVTNRRGFDEYLEQHWKQCLAHQSPLALILCDVDYFKPFNDTYGHVQGDEVLSQVARALTHAVKRPEDLVARYGGEEFGVVLPNTTPEGARHVAEQIHQEIKKLAIPHQSSQVGDTLTVSLGLTCDIPTEDQSPSQLIQKTDQALYQAKKDGRNQTAIG